MTQIWNISDDIKKMLMQKFEEFLEYQIKMKNAPPIKCRNDVPSENAIKFDSPQYHSLQSRYEKNKIKIKTMKNIYLDYIEHKPLIESICKKLSVKNIIEAFDKIKQLSDIDELKKLVEKEYIHSEYTKNVKPILEQNEREFIYPKKIVLSSFLKTEEYICTNRNELRKKWAELIRDNFLDVVNEFENKSEIYTYWTSIFNQNSKLEII